eukprot:g12853.t1
MAQQPTNDDTIRAQANAELLQLVSFEIGTEQYAVPLLAVQSINRMMQVTPAPGQAAFVEGVVNLRGKVIPVVDLRRRLGKAVKDTTGDERIIVVEIQGEAGTHVVGLVVSKVDRVLRIGGSTIEQTPDTANAPASAAILGVARLDGGPLARGILNKIGFDQLEEACDGVDALQKVASFEPELILVDWNMPEMNGLAFVQQYRAQGGTAPVIMVSGEAEKARVVAAMKAGVNNYIIKPFTPDTMSQRIRETLERNAAA